METALQLGQALQWRGDEGEGQDYSAEIQTQVRQSAAQGEQAVTVISNGQVSTEEDTCHTQITHIHFCFLSGVRDQLCRDDTKKRVLLHPKAHPLGSRCGRSGCFRY